MSKHQYQKVDVEAGTEPLFPTMQESPELRWSFIRKVYSILTLQLLLTVAVAAVVVYVHPISQFLVTTRAGIALYSVFNVMSFLTLCLLYGFYQRHPWNILLLALYTVSIAFSLGLTCAFTSGAVILESAILTSVVVVSLTLYTFWAAKKGHDFSFIQPFICSASLVLLVFILIQVFFLVAVKRILRYLKHTLGAGIHLTPGPLSHINSIIDLGFYPHVLSFFPIGKLSIMILGALVSILLCGYIICEILAAISLYLEVLNLFVSLLSIFQAAES